MFNNKYLIHITFALLLTTLSLRVCAQEAAPYNCGISSIFSLVKSYDYAASITNEKEIVNSYPQQEVSLSQVKQMADMAGLKLTGIKANLSDLVSLGHPSIVHLSNPSHFTVFEAQTSDGVRLLENMQYKFMKKDEFDSRFDGYALTNREVIVGGPKLLVNEFDYQSGSVIPRQELSHSFNLYNVGDSNLNVDVAYISCGCTAAYVGGRELDSTLSIKPKENVSIKIEYKASTIEKQLQYIILRTNDKASPSLSLSLRGYISQSTKPSISSLRFNTRKGEAANKSFLLLSKSSTSIERFELHDPNIRVEYSL